VSTIVRTTPKRRTSKAQHPTSNGRGGATSRTTKITTRIDRKRRRTSNIERPTSNIERSRGGDEQDDEDQDAANG
jgi:hypothetical protein